MMRVMGVCVVLMAAGCAGTREGAPAQVHAPADDGVTEFGRQVPRLVERYLDEAGERGENGWQVVADITALIWACPAISPTHSEEEPVDFELVYFPESGKEDQRARALDALRQLDDRGLFNLLDVLSQQRRVVQPAQRGEIGEWEIPEAGALRKCIQIERARLYLAAERWDSDGVIRSFENLMAIGRVASYGTSALEHIIGLSAVCYAAQELTAHTMRDRISRPVLLACMEAIERQMPLAPVTLGLEANSLLMRDAVHFTYHHATLTPAQRTLHLIDTFTEEKKYQDVSPAKAELLLGIVAGHASEETALAHEAELLRRILDISRLPPRDGLREARQLQEDIRRMRPYSVPLMITPGVTKVVLTSAQARATLEGFRVFLAVELWRAEQGEYPASLDELPPRLLARPAIDPYTGEPFRYRRLAEPDDIGRGYVLYSVGLDGVDDGGREDPDRIAVATSEKGEGYDFVINARVLVR